MNECDPSNDENVWRKSRLNKMPLVFEFFNSIYHCQMTEYTIEFQVCGVYGCHICGRVERSFRDPVTSNGELRKEMLRWLDPPAVNPTDRDHFLSQ